jgi:hypothetical protein
MVHHVSPHEHIESRAKEHIKCRANYHGEPQADIVFSQTACVFSRRHRLHVGKIALLFALCRAPYVNPSSVTSVLFRETLSGAQAHSKLLSEQSPSDGCQVGPHYDGLRWDFVRPWQERSLRMSLGEASTHADRILMALDLLQERPTDVHKFGGWASGLNLRLNGTEYMRQAVILHIIRSVCMFPASIVGFCS